MLCIMSWGGQTTKKLYSSEGKYNLLEFILNEKIFSQNVLQ